MADRVHIGCGPSQQLLSISKGPYVGALVSNFDGKDVVTAAASCGGVQDQTSMTSVALLFMGLCCTIYDVRLVPATSFGRKSKSGNGMSTRNVDSEICKGMEWRRGRAEVHLGGGGG